MQVKARADIVTNLFLCCGIPVKREYLLRHRKVHSTHFLSRVSGFLQPASSILPHLCSSIPLPLSSWRNSAWRIPTAICWTFSALTLTNSCCEIGDLLIGLTLWRFYDSWRRRRWLRRQQQRRTNGAQKKCMGPKEGRGWHYYVTRGFEICI